MIAFIIIVTVLLYLFCGFIYADCEKLTAMLNNEQPTAYQMILMTLLWPLGVWKTRGSVR